jgi:2,3-bisphosphoglycerate-independent phosphoglycerate mutase
MQHRQDAGATGERKLTPEQAGWTQRHLSAMKFAIVIPEGAPDRPVEELGGRTPLSAARTPMLDELARRGRLGTARTIPEGMHPTGEVGLLSVLGYDPTQYAVARGPLEAFARGVRLGRRDQAFRCNLVTVTEGVLQDACAGYIRTGEASRIVEDLRQVLPDPRFELHEGPSFRQLLVWRDIGPLSGLQTLPPHVCLGQPIRRNLPRGRESTPLLTFIRRAAEILHEHDVNAVRHDLGENPASGVWPWGQGRLGSIPSFESRFGLRGVAVAGVDRVRGLARLIRWETREVPEATGLLDTGLSAKGAAAVAALDAVDLVCVHVEAADEAGHLGSPEEKVRILERVDSEIVAPLVERLRREPGWRILVIPGHATPVGVRTHADDPVPFVMAGGDIESNRGEVFDERGAAEGELHLERAHELMEYFLRV